MLNQLEKKTLYYERFNYLFSEYSRIVLVDTKNISSNQFKKCRKALGKDSILILGKNKIIKKILKEHIKHNPGLNNLFSHLSGNIGFIFTKTELLRIKQILDDNQVPAPARSGQIAPNDVTIPSGITNITPDGTLFFQALNISTKISKGLVEIQTPVKIITKGQMIGNSEVILLQKLNIIPFSHRFEIKLIFDNNLCIDPKILEISMSEIEEKFERTKDELKFLESLLSYPNTIKIENYRKITITNISFLSKILGFVTVSEKKAGIKIESITEKINVIQSTVDEKNDTEDGDIGFSLFD